jgi:hypothetical protein
MVVLIIENAFSSDMLKALRNDCDKMCGRLSQLDLIEKSCSIDPFETASIPDNSPVRVSRPAYLRKRAELNPIDPVYAKALEAVIFDIVPSLLSRVYPSTDLYLFSENYIVKPPAAPVAFRWHTDADEQLACISPPMRREYLSCWCPLDDVHHANGTLCVHSGAEIVRWDSNTSLAPPDNLSWSTTHLCLPSEDEVGAAIETRSGSIVLFSSSEWHSSGTNHTGAQRRVFYAQYSVGPIYSSKDHIPLSYAVPCTGL